MSEPTKIVAAPGKYLTFALAQEEYGLPVLRVREIIKIMDITAVPQVPAHVKGVINLRGKVIPIVDLRLKVELEARRLMLGVIVDSVSDVLNIAADEIEATPDFGERLDTTYMRGVAKIKGKVKILLDLDRILAVDAGFTQAA
jgi:purine-binding chemotaxis protein CheW